MSARRSKLAPLAAVVLAAGALAIPQAATAAAPAADASLAGLVLTGGCPGASPDLKNVWLAPKSDNLWLPVRFVSGATFEALNAWIFPAEITVTGEGLKTRHMLPGVTLTRPTPVPPRVPVVCEFDGATKEAGEFRLRITGTVVGAPLR